MRRGCLTENTLRVILQVPAIWHRLRISWRGDWETVQPVVISPLLKLFTNALAHLYRPGGRFRCRLPSGNRCAAARMARTYSSVASTIPRRSPHMPRQPRRARPCNRLLRFRRDRPGSNRRARARLSPIARRA